MFADGHVFYSNTFYFDYFEDIFKLKFNATFMLKNPIEMINSSSRTKRFSVIIKIKNDFILSILIYRMQRTIKKLSTFCLLGTHVE
jgi:hypothetical protein